MPLFNIDTYLDRSYLRLKQFRSEPSTKKRERRKQTVFYVYEGYFEHRIDLEDYYGCDCKDYLHKNLCAHNIYLLCYHFKLSPEIVISLTDIKLYTCFVDFLKSTKTSTEGKEETMDNQIYRKICDHFKEHECGVCLLDLTDPKYHLKLYQCEKCEKYCRSACFETWCRTHKSMEKPCIYCRT